MSRLFDLLFPPKCPFCRRVLKNTGEKMCPQCRDKLPYVRSGRDGAGSFYSKCISPLYYTRQVRRAVLAFKFYGKTGYAACFADLMADSIRKEGDGFDIITWVPLSRARLRKRGYSQARLLAEAVADRLGMSAERLLDKPKDIRPQSRIINDAALRRANVNGAYALRRGAEIQGKRILLIDDIMTTGATLSECAKVMLQAGAEDVICAVLCRGKKLK